MHNLSNIVNQALNLLRRSPQGAALTISLAGGGSEFISPRVEPYMVSVISASGRMRGGETRPAIDLRLYVSQRNDIYHAHIERITGLGIIASIPDHTEHVLSVQASSLDELELALVSEIDNKVKVPELRLAKASYRKDNFTSANFELQEVARGLRALLSRRPEDINLRHFVDDTVGDALRFDGGYPATAISLWFTLGETLKTLYVTIGIENQGGKTVYSVTAEDRACWPWKDKAIGRRVSTQADARKLVADYIAKNYSFRVTEVSTYFNWS